MADTERAVYLQRLDPDQREAYVTAHDDVPDGVTDAMERGGVEEFELYVRDDIAVCILDCADLEAYFDAIDGDDALTDWERYTSQFKRSGVDADADPESSIPFMEQVWRFDPDAE